MVTLLAVGDIHLGRRPTRLPDLLGEHGVAVTELTPAAAWRATVEEAVRLAVDAVLLAGDVVDTTEDRFEAYGHLEAGVRRLVEAGIQVFGVAGNHDVEALPRLARRIDGFRLLGEGGHWETVEVVGRDGRVELLGWSFPSRRVAASPLEGGLPTRTDGVARVGLLHCDVDGHSAYAPVARAALEGAAVDGWLLGHIHRPDLLTGLRPIGYLGSLVGLDPGEAGPHGPWRVTVEAGRVAATHLPFAPLRWEEEAVAVEAVRGGDDGLEEAVGEAAVAALERIHHRLSAGATPRAVPRVVGCRLRLTGRSPDHAAVAAAATGEAVGRISLVRDDTVYFVERVVDDALPAVDLDALARGDDPPGLLARHLLALERGEGGASPLPARARAALEAVAARPWPGLDPVDDADPRPYLRRVGVRLLEQLLAQRGPR